MLFLLLSITASFQSFRSVPFQSLQDPPEILITSEGLLAIDSPKGWVRVDSDALAFFVPKGETIGHALAVIYISFAPIGPETESKTIRQFIDSDVAGFKKRYKKGFVLPGDPLLLPHAKQKVPVYNFQSGEDRNSFEQVIYIPEGHRVLILTLSSKKKKEYENNLEAFHQFAISYRGGIETN